MAELLKNLWLGIRQDNPGPMIRRAMRWSAAIALFLVALLLYAPALGSTRFVYGTDTTSHDYIMHFYGWVRSIITQGELPLWNPYIFSGLPMIGSAALCPFYPTQWLYFILPFNLVFTLQYVFAVTVGGLGAAYWMRCLGMRRSLCLWAGLIYMVSGHFLTLTYAGHLQKMIALGWTPIALGATLQLVRLGRAKRRSSQAYKAVAVLGLALGMQLLASHPQVFYATAAACILQLVGVALTAVPWRATMSGAVLSGDNSPSRSLGAVGRAILLSGLALAICVFISAVQLFPTWEMSGMSNRAEGVSFAEAVETSYPPLELLEYAVPQVFGDSVQGTGMPYFGKWGERIVSDYVGLPILALAVIGLFGSRRRYRWFLLTLFFAGILIGLGRYTPIYWLLYYVLPGFDGFRSPGTFMFLANCALVGLATFGLDRLVTLAQEVNGRGWDSTFTPPVTENLGTTTHPPGETQPFHVDSIDYSGTDTPPHNPSIEYDETYDDNAYNSVYAPTPTTSASSNFMWDADEIPWLGRPAVLVFLAALAVTALVAAIIALAENWDVDLKIATDAERMSYHMYSKVAGATISIMVLLGGILLLRMRAAVGGIVIALAAIAFPLYYNYHFLKFEPLNPYMAHLTRQPDLLQLAKTAPQPVRLFEENMLKNEAMLSGISSATGYHPIILAHYGDALAALGAGSDEMGSLFAVNHARTSTGNSPEDGQWLPDTSAPEAAGGRQAMWLRAHPSPYIRDEAELVSAEIDDVSLTSSSLRSIAEDAAVGRGAGAQPANGDSYLARVSDYDAQRFRLADGVQMAEATLNRWSPHEVRLHASAGAEKPGGRTLLPLSEPYCVGWYAETSARKRLPIIPVNGLQRGLVLPAGEHNIRMVYSPFSFRLGLFFSLLSATVLISFGMGTLSRRILRGKKKVEKVIKRAQTGKQLSIDA